MKRLTSKPDLSVTFRLTNESRMLVVNLAESIAAHPLQLESLERYEESNLIRVKVLDEQGSSSLAYDIACESNLQQALLYKKLTRQDFVNLLASCLQAMSDVKALGMSSSGIVFDPEFIFINPYSFASSFVFLPIYKDDLGLINLREFILEIIVSDAIEDTGDNFVQLMISALNPKSITIDSLVEVIRPWLIEDLCLKEAAVDMLVADEPVTEITTEIAIQHDLEIPYLEYRKDGDLVKIPLNKSVFVIGRKSNEVDYICQNPRVSKNHVSIIQRDGGFLVVDNDSNNGTFIDSKESRLSSFIEYELRPDSTLIVADDEFVLRTA